MINIFFGLASLILLGFIISYIIGILFQVDKVVYKTGLGIILIAFYFIWVWQIIVSVPQTPDVNLIDILILGWFIYGMYQLLMKVLKFLDR